MNRIPFQNPNSNLFTRILGAVISQVILAGLLFVGFTVFVFAAGVAVVLFLLFYARIWWVTRKMRRQAAQSGAADHGRTSGGDGVTLEGEFEEKK